MAYSNIARYTAPENPVQAATDTTVGWSWEFIGPSEVMAANIPRIGEIWGDGRPVTSFEFTPGIGNSTVSKLVVSTATSATGGGDSSGGTIGTELTDAPHYTLRWIPQSLPLLKHPDFAGLSAANLGAIMSWEAELSELNRANFQYFERDENGDAKGTIKTITNPASAAYKYVALRLLGHENYVFFAPTWSKVSIYKGMTTPGVGSIGQKESPPSGSGFPSGWEWVKTDDSAEKEGRSTIWRRTETWTGARKVDYDVDQIFL